MAPWKDKVPERFVTPGEQLGVIEEFIAGSGTFVAGAEIYASEAGTMRLDTRRREVLVVPRTHRPQIPRAGDMVEGPVVSASDKTLSMEIKGINGDPTSGGLTGIMHVSDIARGYVKSATDAFRVGDIIRAKVVSTKNREYHLTTAEDRLGAVKANCIYCGGGLILTGSSLRCGKCSEMARRKITSDFSQPSSGWVTA